MSRGCFTLTLCLLAVPLPGRSGPADCWPDFRNGGSGRSNARGLPLEWSPTRNLAWKADLPGYGQSSPVVWKGAVYVTAINGPDREKNLVVALDGRTGKQAWSVELPVSETRKVTNMNSRAAPTLAVDADGLYVFFESGDLFALSHDGKRRWSRSLVKDHGAFKSGHGIGSSLAQTKDLVLVLVDHQGPSYLLAVDKKTGKDRWKAERPSRVSWASPVVVRSGERECVVVSGNGSIRGYDVADGKECWGVEGISGNTLPSASVAGEGFIVVGAGEARGSAAPGQAAKSNCCLKLTEKEGKLAGEIAWSAKKATSSYATPLAYRGCAYFVNTVGVAFCLDLKTGVEHYAERLSGACWASPIGAGDHVFFFSKDGTATVVKVGPKFEVVARNRLWEPEARPADDRPADRERQPGGGEGRPGIGPLDPVVYAAVSVEGAFFIRTGTALFCVRGRQP